MFRENYEHDNIVSPMKYINLTFIVNAPKYPQFC